MYDSPTLKIEPLLSTNVHHWRHYPWQRLADDLLVRPTICRTWAVSKNSKCNPKNSSAPVGSGPAAPSTAIDRATPLVILLDDFSEDLLQGRNPGRRLARAGSFGWRPHTLFLPLSRATPYGGRSTRPLRPDPDLLGKTRQRMQTRLVLCTFNLSTRFSTPPTISILFGVYPRPYQEVCALPVYMPP